MLKLHSYQERAVNLFVRNGLLYQMLDAGLGKTAICLKAIERLGKPALIFGPRLAMTMTWPDEIKKWTPNLSYTVMHGSNKNHYAKLSADKDITLLNYEGLKWFIRTANKKGFTLRKFVVIFDESSMIKWRGRETKAGGYTRFEMMRQIRPIYGHWRTALSATPVPKSLIELWAQYYLLDEGKRLTGSFYNFRNRFFNYTGYPRFSTTLRRGSDKKIYNAIKDITFQLNAEDHLKMPPLVQNIVKIPMPDKLRKVYEKMDEEYIVEFKDGNVAVANSQATAGNKLRQILQGGVYTDTGKVLLKSPAKAEWLREFVDNSAGNPVMCAIEYKFEYEVICNVFNQRVPIVAGSSDKAVATLQQYKAGKLPLILVNPASMARSLNLQAGGHILVWLALPWSYDLYYQLVRRLYRQGQERSVLSHAVCFEDSMDLQVAMNLQRKFKTDSKLKKAMGKIGLQL